MEPLQIQKALFDLLSQGKKISFKWDCGGDEAFVYTFVDGEPLAPTDDLSEGLELFLLIKLNLPDAGEFSMKGEGLLIVKDKDFFIQYQSTMIGYEGEDGWTEVNEVAQEWSGEKNIFK